MKIQKQELPFCMEKNVAVPFAASRKIDWLCCC